MDIPTASLIKILAQTDTSWYPLRTDDLKTQQVTYELRRLYEAEGTPWFGGGDVTARKQNSRLLSDLASNGHIQLNTLSDRKHNVRLTDSTERRLRALCDLPGIDDGLATLKELARLTKSRKKLHKWPGEWIQETGFFNNSKNLSQEKYQNEVNTVAMMAMPAIIKGWIEANCTVMGTVRYKITQKGRKILANVNKINVDQQDYGFPKDEMTEAHQFYIQECDKFYEWLLSQEPNEPSRIPTYHLPVH